ncbi:MAG: hypothetical protein JJU46_13780 [Balneolaceae bacterium]|nr:hypothetical protein [Balneolaceae bacterium]MCH8548119.1 hypothetical protein [Balneolaceae bacterium]
MGRAMLIIVSGLLLSVGLTQTSLFGGLGQMVTHSANITEAVQAKNVAYMGTELAIREMIDDPDWRDGSSATFNVGGGTAAVNIEETTDGMLRLNSNGTFNGESQLISILLQENQSSLVPTFFSALGFIMSDPDKFSFKAQGNPLIDGTELSGTCEDKPGVTVNHSEDLSEVEDNVFGSATIDGTDPPIDLFDGLTMDELTQLIEALSPHGTVLDPNRNQHDLGDKDNPGIFIVDSNVRFAGQQNRGAGIMIVRNSGMIEVEEGTTTSDGGIEVRGGFEFDGLVIFENAMKIDGRGNAEFRGSVIVGNTHKNIPKFDADLGGAANIRYDCSAQQYADQAASMLSNNRLFQQLSVYETSGTNTSNN